VIRTKKEFDFGGGSMKRETTGGLESPPQAASLPYRSRYQSFERGQIRIAPRRGADHKIVFAWHERPPLDKKSKKRIATYSD
jgi:hypothetical protein